MEPAVRQASLWEGVEGEPGHARCRLCSHRCRIAPGRRGLCGVRENRDGTLFTLVYGRLVAANVDPIEKKPLFHVAPGSLSYSIATAGCNFRCLHCQNYSISQAPREGGSVPGRYVPAETVVREAVASGCASIAYTYTEPTIFFEYARECMTLAHGQGLLNVFVTNGYMTPECLDAADGLLDAANVDLKSMSDEFYRTVCGARLQPVLDTIRELARRGVWVEVTTLVIPGRNDAEAELREAARFLAGVSPEIPWHVTGFFPTYKLTDAPPTPASTLLRAWEIGREEGLRFVYTGNRPGRGGEDTVCPSCGETAVGRLGYALTRRNLTGDGRCGSCGARIPGLNMGGGP
ncbi:MAG: AmmeMemoRadiSam system radical SAM enzyme [Candidatus Dadabacteria bacterium]|nr:MAG: AmmeMemoRadiSam system radical SAM enzyme [Candidatus Dadabacteria bacterium]